MMTPHQISQISPMGALIWGKPASGDRLKDAADLLGIHIDDASRFISGFDSGGEPEEGTDPWYALGQKFREEFVKKP